jgi:chloride channel 7
MHANAFCRGCHFVELAHVLRANVLVCSLPPLLIVSLNPCGIIVNCLEWRCVASQISSWSLVFYAVIYFVGAAYIAGSTMATGLMVPMLIIGATYGRLIGTLLKGFEGFYGIDPQLNLGSYALIGAASFFGGVTRMTVSLTVIMLEITNQLHFLLPIMIVTMIAKMVGDLFSHPLYDLLIGQAHYPFLETDPSPLFDLLRASDVMASPVICLPIVCTVKEVVQLLSAYSHNGFPVTNDDQGLEGLILRSQLMVLLEQRVWQRPRTFDNIEFQGLMMGVKKDVTDLEFTTNEFDEMIDLRPFMNRSVVSVPIHFSCSIAFRLFRAMGLRHLVVIDTTNVPGIPAGDTWSDVCLLVELNVHLYFMHVYVRYECACVQLE